jgi:protein-S-isoprenylcysteine O-methyltransferase Ste14
LFFLGARHYDARQLLGIKQIREGTSNKAITDSGKLDTTGVLGMIRHPWYAAGILLIWAGQLDVSAILANTIFTAYLIIGALLEERKLVREFGDEYQAYQKRVSMFIPFLWLKAILKQRHNTPTS